MLAYLSGAALRAAPLFLCLLFLCPIFYAGVLCRRFMPKTTRAYIALGSNLGNRSAFLQAAVDALNEHDRIQVTHISSVYESPAHILPGQSPLPDYLNAVIEFETNFSPTDLLDFCLSVETSQGRIRDNETRWAARTLDLDLLLFGSLTLDSNRLTLPHPRLDQRKFVLIPLAEIAPNLMVPAPFNQIVRYLLETCSDRSEVVISDNVLTMPGV